MRREQPHQRSLDALGPVRARLGPDLQRADERRRRPRLLEEAVRGRQGHRHGVLGVGGREAEAELAEAGGVLACGGAVGDLEVGLVDLFFFFFFFLEMKTGFSSLSLSLSLSLSHQKTLLKRTVRTNVSGK